MIRISWPPSTADRRIGGFRPKVGTGSKSQLTPPTLMTNSENPGLHVYRSYLDGVDWRDWVHLEKGFPLWSIRPVLQEARAAPSFQHASAAERDKAANCPPPSSNYRCVVGLVGACPLLSYITPPIIEPIHLASSKSAK